MMNWLANLVKTLFGGIADLSPNCREATRLQSEALDHKLPFRKRLGLRIHLMICKWCCRYGKQVRFLRETAREHPDKLSEPAPQKLSDEARERINQRLRSKSE